DAVDLVPPAEPTGLTCMAIASVDGKEVGRAKTMVALPRLAGGAPSSTASAAQVGAAKLDSERGTRKLPDEAHFRERLLDRAGDEGHIRGTMQLSEKNQGGYSVRPRRTGFVCVRRRVRGGRRSAEACVGRGDRHGGPAARRQSLRDPRAGD